MVVRGFGNTVFSSCIEDSLPFHHFFPILKVSALKHLLGKWECEGGGLCESYSLLSIWQHTCLN